MARNYARKRNNTFFLDYDPDKVQAKYGEEWEDEGPNHPGVVFGAYSHARLVRSGQMAGDTFKDHPSLAATCAVVKRLVGDWTVLEDDPEGAPRYDESPSWPAFDREGLAARRDILLKLDAIDCATLSHRANTGLYLSEDERGN